MLARQTGTAFPVDDTVRRVLRGLPCEARHREDVCGLSSLPAHVGALRLLRLCIGPADAVRKECDWRAERLAETVKSGGTHAGFGLLVLVYLLKRDTQRCGKFLLTYAQFDTPLSDAHRYVNIDWFSIRASHLGIAAQGRGSVSL